MPKGTAAGESANESAGVRGGVQVGVVGQGAFGRLLAGALAEVAPVRAYDPKGAVPAGVTGAVTGGVTAATLAQAAACDVVVFAVNVQDLRDALRAARGWLRDGALVADVCSVKVRALEVLLDEAPAGVDVLGTHPLFGPQTVAEQGRRGQPVALCPGRISPARLAWVRGVLEGSLGLRCVEVTADEHDRQMAHVQVLTHLIGHTAAAMALPEWPLATLAYTRLLQLRRNIEGDSERMFEQIQRWNPHAAAVRRAFVQAVQAVDERARGEAGEP